MTEVNPKHACLNMDSTLQLSSLSINKSSLITEEQLKFICLTCSKSLIKQVKIIAENECYCVGCFAKILPNCDKYSIESHDCFELLGDGWPARDELLLLDGITKYFVFYVRFGFGNWAALQEYMAFKGSNYFKDEIEIHYDKFYGKNEELFQSSLINQSLNKVVNPSKKSRTERKGGKHIENTAVSYCQFNYEEKNKIPCYNSKRGEFNLNYKENLEKLVADIEFKENDSERETELKFQILEAYNQGLVDRESKHRFILEHRLLDKEFQAQEAHSLSLNPYSKKAHELLIGLMKDMTIEEFQELRKSLEFCLRIQTIIDNLRVMRNSNLFSSIKSFGKVDRPNEDSLSEISRPRKKVHKSPEISKLEEEKNILKKLNVSKDELRFAIQKARAQNETVIYKDIKITPLNALVQS